MFLIDKAGTKIRKIDISDVDLRFDFDKQTKDDIHEIFNSAYEKREYLGSIDFAIKYAEREAENYIKGKKKITKIYINGELFGEYEEKKGREVFEKIITAIKSGIDFLDMREFEVNE